MPSWPLPPDSPPIYPSTPGGVTAPTLTGWEFNYNDLTFGAGQPLGILDITGLGALPPVNSQDQAFPRDTGEYIGVDAMGGRTITTDLICTTSIYAEMVTVGGAFAAGGVNEQPLWFQLPGLPTMCSMVRPRTRESDWNTDVSAAGMWRPNLTWHATDPRLYEQAQIAYSASSGSGSTSLTVTNAGNVEVRPVIVLTGPLDSPAVGNTTIGADVQVAFAADTAIGSGDQVVIDFSTPHTVQYFVGGINSPSATYNVYNWLDQSTTSWWTLVAGANSFTASADQGSLAASQFQVWWASAFLL